MKTVLILSAVSLLGLPALAKKSTPIQITDTRPVNEIRLTKLLVTPSHEIGGFRKAGKKDNQAVDQYDVSPSETRIDASEVINIVDRIIQTVKDEAGRPRIELTITIPGFCNLQGCVSEMSKKTFDYVYRDESGFYGKRKFISGEEAQRMSKVFAATRDGATVIVKVANDGTIQGLTIQ